MKKERENTIKNDMPKNESSISIAMEEYNQCAEGIRQYNIQFISSSSFISIMTLIAGITTSTNLNDATWNIFYVLPTFYFLALYNLIKYTIMQESLAAYKCHLGMQIDNMLGKNILIWGKANVLSTKLHQIFFAGIQLIFFVPIGIFIIWGFFNIKKHGIIWYSFCGITILQIITIVILAFILINAGKKAKKKFNEFPLEINHKLQKTNIA